MTAATATLIDGLASSMRAEPIRSLGDFAEQEIVLPDGPYEGRRFRLDRSPVARLLFAELESGRWQRAFITGPNQDGKSLLGFVIPTLWLLFERRERVLFGAPTTDIAHEKWTKDILPVLRMTRYRELLPSAGRGSRGGLTPLMEFKNGAILRVMTAGGDDQSRASFTTPNLIVTETNGFDEVGSTSQEGDKFRQLERRTLAYGERARTVAECTTGTEQGRTWQEIQQGSRSRLAIPCPHCSAWVTPEREHFVGWAEAETELEAVEKAHVCCPACGAAWTNEQRIDANRRAVLVHRGQEVQPDGTVTGSLPPTNTLGFRWSVINSVLNPNRLPMVGGIEWRARRAADEEIAEADVCQSQWALPKKPDAVDLTQLDAFAVMRRTLRGIGRGVVPEGTQFITCAADCGKWLHHWVALAWRANATPHVIDYGRLEVPSADMDVEIAVATALRSWRDETVRQGWGGIKPVLTFVDAGEWQESVQRFCIESGEDFVPSKGHGISQRRAGQQKRDTGTRVVGVGEKYNLIELPNGTRVLEINVDHWKGWLHARLHTPVDQPGALTLFDPQNNDPKGNDHLSYCKHLTAEKQVEEFDPAQGVVKRWVAHSRNNHWFDATTYACVAGYAGGARLAGTAPAQQQPPRSDPPPAAQSSANWIPPKKW